MDIPLEIDMEKKQRFPFPQGATKYPQVIFFNKNSSPVYLLFCIFPLGYMLVLYVYFESLHHFGNPREEEPLLGEFHYVLDHTCVETNHGNSGKKYSTFCFAVAKIFLPSKR